MLSWLRAFDSHQLLFVSFLDVHRRILFGVFQAASAAEIDCTSEHLGFDVFVGDGFAGHRTGFNAIAFAFKLGLSSFPFGRSFFGVVFFAVV